MRKICNFCKKEKNINNSSDMCHECAIIKSMKNISDEELYYYKNLKYEFGKRNTPVSYFLSKNYNIIKLKEFHKEQYYSKSKSFYENVFENKFTIIFDCGFEKLSF